MFFPHYFRMGLESWLKKPPRDTLRRWEGDFAVVAERYHCSTVAHFGLFDHDTEDSLSHCV
jgi:hypothetical protein